MKRSNEMMSVAEIDLECLRTWLVSEMDFLATQICADKMNEYEVRELIKEFREFFNQLAPKSFYDFLNLKYPADIRRMEVEFLKIGFHFEENDKSKRYLSRKPNW